MDESPASPPPQIVIQQQASMFGRFGKFLLIALGLAVMGLIGLASSYQSYFNPPNGPQEKFHSLSKTATSKIAVIGVEGAIIDGDGFVKKQIDRVRKDEDVVAVVARINSPGGTVTASDYLYHHLRELAEERDLPLVVSMGSICASGGYYIAMAVGDQENTVYAEPTTWTGSIGVIIPHYDVSGLMDEWNVKEDSITSGPLKDMGSPTHPMTERERKVLQELVDESFEDFKDIVRRGRPALAEDDAALEAVTTGQIFTADQAVQNGLVDKIGFVEEAIERAAELAGVGTDDVRCVKYTRPQSAIDALMGARAPQPAPLDLAHMLNLMTPRAWYLYSWLPAALANSP